MAWPFSRKSAAGPRTYSVDKFAQMVAGWIGYGTSTGVPVNETLAMETTAVFCAVRVIGEGMGQMPIRLMQETFDGNWTWRKPVPDHWAHRLLAVRPNDWQTPFEFVEGMTIAAALGRGAIAIKNTVGGEVRELLPVPPHAWTVQQLPDWSIQYRIDYADKTHDVFDQSQVLHLRGPSLDGFDGLPAIRAAREAIGLSRALEMQQARLAANGGKPTGLISFKAPPSAESREKLRKQWQTQFGPGGEGGIGILDGDASFSSLTMTSVDAQFLETRRMQIEEIGRAFRVLPIMMMQADKAATFASWEQMLRAHITHTLGPWEVRWEQALNRDILGNQPGLVFDMDERALLRGDFKDQAEYYTKALGAGGQPGWMCVNDIRQEVGMNPSTEAWASEIPRGAMNAPAADAAQTQDTTAPAAGAAGA